jgi:hypothetical protein
MVLGDDGDEPVACEFVGDDAVGASGDGQPEEGHFDGALLDLLDEVLAGAHVILADAGIAVVLSGVQMPRMNSIVERWVQTCRPELLDRALIWNQRHLFYALREYERYYNTHRPHQGIANTRPSQPLPEPITDPAQISQLDIRRHPRLGGILNEYHHAA